MGLTKKQRRIEINYRQLQTSGGMEVVGSVAARQSYDSATEEFAPDYTLTPLVLYPRCTATDPDKYTKSGVVNASLTNMHWYERIGGTRTEITASNANYIITQSGDQKGQIQVKKNSSVLNPTTLEFEAEYADTRTGQVFKFRLSQVVICNDQTDAAPTLSIDSPSTLEWNPVRQQKQQAITATLMSGNTDVTDSENTAFFWYRLNGTSLEQITDGGGDNDWEVVSIEGNKLVIDRDFIGEEQTYVCRAHYSADGTAPSAPSVSDPTASTVIRRRIPKVECDWQGVTQGVPGGTSVILPEGFVRDTLGVIEDPEEWFKFIWYTKAKGAANYTKAAVGRTPRIPFTDGMMLQLEVEDKGPQAIIVDDDDTSVYITDTDDLPLYQRMYEESNT